MKFCIIFVLLTAFVATSWAEVCGPTNDPSDIVCEDWVPGWFYDVATNRCVDVQGRGCYHTSGRFHLKETCEITCVL